MFFLSYLARLCSDDHAVWCTKYVYTNELRMVEKRSICFYRYRPYACGWDLIRNHSWIRMACVYVFHPPDLSPDPG